MLGRRKQRGDAGWVLPALGAAPPALCFTEPGQADKEEGDSEGRSERSVAAQPLRWRCLTLLKGTKLLCVSVNPRLPPPAASLVRAFSVINSAFPGQGGWSSNPLYPWGETEHQSPLPVAAAGAQGLGRAVAPRVEAPAVAVELIKVVLCSELGCAGWSLWSSSLQCPWPSEQQCRTLLSLGKAGLFWNYRQYNNLDVVLWSKKSLFPHSPVNPVSSALPMGGFQSFSVP